MPDRGTMLGNRGGKFHRSNQTLGKRRWASHHWICCELQYKALHHEPMGQGYTSLFFLDEVTALAAGHRPCFFCRRKDAREFVRLSGMTTGQLDAVLHGERLGGPAAEREVLELPDGTMIESSGEVLALRKGLSLPWSFGGYGQARRAPPRAKLLTPPTIVSILQAGFKPRWHPSAHT